MMEQENNNKKAYTSNGPKRKSKATNFPRRPLSAYNMFFKFQRHCIIHGLNGMQDIDKVHDIICISIAKCGEKKRIHRTSHGKIGFAELARRIAESWRVCDASLKAYFQELSKRDKKRYDEEKIQYSLSQLERIKLSRTHPPRRSTLSESEEQTTRVRERADIEPLPLASLQQQFSLDEDARDFILSALLRDE